MKVFNFVENIQVGCGKRALDGFVRKNGEKIGQKANLNYEKWYGVSGSMSKTTSFSIPLTVLNNQLSGEEIFKKESEYLLSIRCQIE